MSCGHLANDKGNEQWSAGPWCPNRELSVCRLVSAVQCRPSLVKFNARRVSAMCCDLHWPLGAYSAVLPKKRHRSVDKRQLGLQVISSDSTVPLDNGLSRLVEGAYRSPKVGWITLQRADFVHHYNATRRRKLGLAWCPFISSAFPSGHQGVMIDGLEQLHWC